MSHAAAHAHADKPAGHAAAPQLSHDNIHLSGKGGLGLPLIVVGLAVAVGGVIAGKSTPGGLAHGLAAYHVATMSILAVCLGATFFVLVWNLLNAGWSSTIRRQAENIMSFLPYAFLLILPTLILNNTPLFAQVLFFGALLSAILSTASGALLPPARR